MRNFFNNKGFTLVELLAVLVILAAIMGIAIPSITSSLERNKDKQNASKYRMLESFAEIYVTDHRNAIYNGLGSNPVCWIDIKELENGGYLTDDVLEDADGGKISGYIIFNKVENSYTYSNDRDGNECLVE